MFIIKKIATKNTETFVIYFFWNKYDNLCIMDLWS